MAVLVHNTTAYRRFPEDAEMTACRRSPNTSGKMVQKTPPSKKENATTAFFWDTISNALAKLYPIEMTRSVGMTHF